MASASTTSPTKVVVVGCGIAGPVLALFLQRKGYAPVVYERAARGANGGISLMLQPNGLRVLSLLPAIYNNIPGHAIQRAQFFSSLPSDPGLLASSSDLARIKDEYGFALTGTQRGKFHDLLIRTVEDAGIPVHFGHHAVGFSEEGEQVRVSFANGASDVGAFVVGCDGLHSDTRVALFGREKAEFTGLTQTGGCSEKTADSPFADAMTNVFADGAHCIAYQISDTLISWAITLREEEAKETWRAMDAEKQDAFRHSEYANWGSGVGELVRNAVSITKYGLYDRPELKSWHKGRIVLLGDAAHPTSPHLGQGANQALEDIYHLVRLLPVPSPSPIPTSTLTEVFAKYEQLRIPRTAALVRGARAQGESRVVSGAEAGKARNDAIRAMWGSGQGEGKEGSLLEAYRDILEAPFVGEPEI